MVAGNLSQIARLVSNARTNSQAPHRKHAPLLAIPRRTHRVHRAVLVPAAAHEIGMLLAAAEEAVKPGSVDAPIGAIIGGALLVTIALTAGIPALLNPGDKAAQKIFDRDARSGRKR